MAPVTAQIRELVEHRRLAELSEDLKNLTTTEVVDLIDSLPTDDAAVVLRLLGKEDAIDVFEELDSGTQTDLVAAFGHEELRDIFASLDPEEQAWLLDELPAKIAKRIMATLGGEQLAIATTLLGYPENSIGRRMSPQSIRTTEDETLTSLRRRIRQHAAAPELYARIPVLSPRRTLVGMVELPDVIGHDGDTHVGEVMESDPRYAFAEENDEIVARRVLDDGDLLLPIVDREHRLVGIFPIGDAARIDREAVAEDAARAGAREPLRRPYLLSSVLSVARSRIVWLLVLAVSAILTVQVLEVFEATLAQRVALALFVPLLIGIGGNTGSQAATTVTRALAVGDVDLRDIWKVAFKEVRTGLLLGSVLAVLAFGVASVFYGTEIGLVLGLTLIINCPIAATVGGVIPLVAKAAKVDPAVFSTPFISTFCDATGLLMYFLVAKMVLGI